MIWFPFVEGRALTTIVLTLRPTSTPPGRTRSLLLFRVLGFRFIKSLQSFNELNLTAQTRAGPRLSGMCHIRSTAFNVFEVCNSLSLVPVRDGAGTFKGSACKAPGTK